MTGRDDQDKNFRQGNVNGKKTYLAADKI